MINLETKYLGLTLRNPLIVSSSGLTATLEKIERIALAGAGAVVLKSVFEEQIAHETTHLESYSAYTEAADYLQYYLKEDYLSTYLNLISQAKQKVNIPIIASICCVAAGEWVEFARRVESAGADALELNIFLLPTDRNKSAVEIERQYLEIVNSVTSVTKLPVAVKIGSHFTNILNVVTGVGHNGAKGVVLFNRFYEPDIDIEAMSLCEADIFSTSAELRNSLRWIAMCSAATPEIDLAVSTGIHTGKDAVKALLAGATVYEVCSAVYQGGMGVVNQINGVVEQWMMRHGFEKTSEFIGRLNYASVENPMAYERSQFMKYFGSYNK